MCQSTYLRALRAVSVLTVHLGHFLTSTVRMPLAKPIPGGPRTVEVIKTEEKGSDVNLAAYLLADAFRADADTFVVVSNDSDLIEPIRLVSQELGNRVGILKPASQREPCPAADPTEFYQADPPRGPSGQPVPEKLSDAHGPITKSATW